MLSLTGELVLAEKPLFTVPAEAHDSDLDQYLENALEVFELQIFKYLYLYVHVFVHVFVPV